jgi:hypothetical protein
LIRIQFRPTFVRGWVALCLVWAAIIAFSHRHEMDPDGFTYLQMADRAAHGDLHALVNPLWSSGYPALLAILLAVIRPAPQNAFVVAHVLNYLLFVAATAAFVYFLQGWRRLRPDYDWLVVPTGFVLFLKFSVEWLGLHNCTPDLGLAVVVLAAAGILCRAALDGRAWILMPVLGLTLGLGYYVKAPLFLLSLFLLAVLFILPPSPRMSRFQVLVAVLTFAAVTTPLVLLQSQRSGHLTYSESGPLNYAWHVNGIHGVQRAEPLDPRVHFVHPPRHLTDHPVTLEFATPVQATYPIWFDPAYWAEGVHPAFNLKQQLVAIAVTLTTYLEMAMEIAPVIAAALVLLATGSGPFWPPGRRSLWILLWPLAAIAMYALVHTERRYIAGFAIILFIAVLTAGFERSTIVSKGALIALMSIALLLPPAFRLVLASARSVASLLHPKPSGDVETAKALRADGLKDGDGIALVGPTFEPYYAWIAHLRVVAQTPDQEEVWRLSPTGFREWLRAVARSGAKAIVAVDRPAYANQVAWQDLPVTDEHSSTILEPGPHRYSILLLP